MSDGDIHTMPVDDLKEHTCSPDCPCEPDVEVIGANLYYRHHSWDGRELFEQLEEMGITV